jgi:hypothetical protein
MITNEIVVLLIFAVLFLALRLIVNRGMDRAEAGSPATATIGVAFWLFLALVALPALCLLPAALGGLL